MTQKAERQMNKVLVANRGEIAARIARAVREEGMIPVGIYEAPDRGSGHLLVMTESVCIGQEPLKGYLDVDAVVDAALRSGCDAVHPGYGFLSESPSMTEACRRAGLVFIGPAPETMRSLGDKVRSRALAVEAGLPVIPASRALAEGDEGVREAVSFGRRYGYPLMLKAVSGGGGRGIRKVTREEELAGLIRLASKEAGAGFGDARVYLEKAISRPMHVEVQIVGDAHGTVVHLGTRNCSVQRRHQKLFEVAPSLVAPALEAEISRAAVEFARHVGYVNVGTVEFLIDEDGGYYFMEMNARLQVEHPITELITGIDIVRTQLDVARGERLPFRQEDIVFQGFAVEARINAEDPSKDFLPERDRRIERCRFPEGRGVRVDTVAGEGYLIPGAYDSLLAKLAVRGISWEDALDRLEEALGRTEIEGVATTIPLFQRMVVHPALREGRLTTAFLEDHPELVRFHPAGGSGAEPSLDDSDDDGEAWGAACDSAAEIGDGDGTVEIRSHIPGVVEEVLVAEGDRVSEGSPVVIIEAMKMFCNIESTADGVVTETIVRPGQHIRSNDLLARIRVA